MCRWDEGVVYKPTSSFISFFFTSWHFGVLPKCILAWAMCQETSEAEASLRLAGGPKQKKITISYGAETSGYKHSHSGLDLLPFRLHFHFFKRIPHEDICSKKLLVPSYVCCCVWTCKHHRLQDHIRLCKCQNHVYCPQENSSAPFAHIPKICTGN